MKELKKLLDDDEPPNLNDLDLFEAMSLENYFSIRESMDKKEK